jgi:hypothetical protein
MISILPSDGGVIASFPLLSHMTSREHLYAFYDLWRGFRTMAGCPFVLPEEVKYALIDLRDPWMLPDLQQDGALLRQRVNGTFLNGDWHILSHEGSLYLLERRRDGSGIRKWR